MNISSIQTYRNPNFRAIHLSAKEAQFAANNIEALINISVEESKSLKPSLKINEKKVLKNKLFSIFDKHLKKEAMSKTYKFHDYYDVLAELYLKFSEFLNDIQKNPTLELLIKKLNEFKPSAEAYKFEPICTSLDMKLCNSEHIETRADRITEEDLPKPKSAIEKENDKERLDTLFYKTNLSQVVERRIQKRMKGQTFKDIAKEENVSDITVWESVRKGILKIQLDNNLSIPERYSDRIKELALILQCSENDAEKIVLKHTNLLSKNIEIIKINIKKSSELLGCTEQEFIKISLRDPTLLNLTPQTIKENIKNSAIMLNCSEEDFIKAGMKQPCLFYYKSETLKNNVNKSAELLDCSTEDFVKAALKIGTLFYLKPENLKNNAQMSAKLLNISETEFIKMALRQPPLFNLKPETIKHNAEEMAKIFHIPLEKYVKQFSTRPSTFCRKPENLKKKIQINNYFQKIKKEPLQNNILLISDDKLYSRILAYLIQQLKDKNLEKFVKVRREFDLEAFVKSNADKDFSFEIPADEVAEDFVKFVQEASVKAIGKNIFEFKITE